MAEDRTRGVEVYLDHGASFTMDVTVLIHPKYKSFPAVVEAVTVVNQLQADFVLRLEQVDWIPNGAKEIGPKDEMRLVRIGAVIVHLAA